MALRWIGKIQAGLWAAACLFVSGCGEQVASDTAIIREFRSNQAEFEKIIHIACEAPPISSIEITERISFKSISESPSSFRLKTIHEFMKKYEIDRVYFKCDNSTFASFAISSAGLGVSGQLKSLVYSPVGMSENSGGVRVDDTDVAVAQNHAKWTLVHRDIGDGWFITNSR